MMTGRLFIDGKDAYAQWGVYAATQCWNALVQFPPLKTPEVNDWHERDGEETDLDTPVLDARDIQLTFNCNRGTDGFMAFIKAMASGVYHEFDIRSIGLKRTLRYVSAGSLSYARGLVIATLTFSEDNPTVIIDASAPDANSVDTLVSLDGVPLRKYGVAVLGGLTASLLTPPAVKKGLTREIAEVDGVQYDSADIPHYEARDIRLPLLTRADSLAGLWKNRDRLLRDLVKPGARELEAIAKKYQCRYKSCQVTAFWPDKRPWLESTLTLRFIGAYLGD